MWKPIYNGSKRTSCAYFLNILIFSHENIRDVENETREIIVENKL